MLKFISSLVVVLTFSAAGCVNLPKNVDQNNQLQPGQTVFESTFLKGIPDWYGEMNGELAVRFPDGSYWLVRNGRLSHQLGLSNYGLKVDSIAGKAPKAKSYFVAIPKSKEQDLFWQNFKEIMARAAQERGLKVVNDVSSADALIEFDFAQAEKEEVTTQTDLVPVTTYSVNRADASSAGQTNYFNSIGQPLGSARGTGQSQGTVYSSSTSQVPVVSTSMALKYIRGLTVNGISKKDRRTIWTVNVNSQGSTGDRRTNFAALTFAAHRFFEQDSGQESVFPIATNDPYISYLKTGSEAGIFKGPVQQWKGIVLDFCALDSMKWRGARFGYSPVGLAIKLASLETTKALVECGHDLDVSLPTKSSPVLAAESGNNELFEYVLGKMKGRNESTFQQLSLMKNKAFAAKYDSRFPVPKSSSKPAKAAP